MEPFMLKLHTAHQPLCVVTRSKTVYNMVWWDTDYIYCQSFGWVLLNTLRPGQNGRHFADNIFKCILLNENVWIPIKISLKFVPKSPINNIPALVQIMAWRRPGDKPLSEPMMVSLLTNICVTRPQWVNMWYWYVNCIKDSKLPTMIGKDTSYQTLMYMTPMLFF